MVIEKIHPFTGKINELDLNITQEQLDRWANGEHIQNVMPNLSADEREFLISGLLPGEYDDLFGDEDGDYDEFDALSGIPW